MERMSLFLSRSALTTPLRAAASRARAWSGVSCRSAGPSCRPLDICRSNVAEGTELGRLAKAYLDAGELVPDEVTIGMVMQAIDQAPVGFIVDGFPRNIRQAEALEAELAARDAPLSAGLAFLVDEETAVKRIAGRRTCANCQRPYNVFFDPPRAEGV